MMSIVHRQTHLSPFVRAVNGERWLKDPFYQRKLVEEALRRFLDDPFEQGLDLRGSTFTLRVSSDGASVTTEATFNGVQSEECSLTERS